MGSTPDEGAPDGFETAAAELRIDLEIEARRRERWIRHRLNEEATLRGALGAALGEEVAVQLTTGDRVSGRLASLGSDVVELRRRHGATWIAIEALTVLEVAAPLRASGPPGAGSSMVEVLCDLVEHRRVVVFTLAGGTSISGELLAVGDLATVDIGPAGRTAYVPLAAIVSVSSAG